MRTDVNYRALQTGGAGNPKAWAIITAASSDLEGRKVAAFMNLDSSAEGTFSAVTEELVPAEGETPAVVEEKDAGFLANTYPFGVAFEGVYTLLTPEGSSRFKVWFLEEYVYTAPEE